MILWNSQLMMRRKGVWMQRRTFWSNYSPAGHLRIAAPINKPLYLFSQPKLHRISTHIGFCSQGPIFAFVHLLLQFATRFKPRLAPDSGFSFNCNNSPLLIPFGPGCANKSKSIELQFCKSRCKLTVWEPNCPPFLCVLPCLPRCRMNCIFCRPLHCW